jgi:hypothetical protein
LQSRFGLLDPVALFAWGSNKRRLIPETALDRLRRTEGDFKLGFVAVDLFGPYVAIFRRFEGGGEASNSDIVAQEQDIGACTSLN